LKRTTSKVLRQRAAVGALRQIAEHRSRADHRVKPLLAYLAEHLFDADLTLLLIQRGCKVRDRAIFTLFHANTGQSLWAYVIDRRLDTAAELLRSTRLKVWQIALLTGYKNNSTFACAFGKRFHLRPMQYRLRQRGKLPAPELAAATEADPEATTEDQHQSLLRELRLLQARLSGKSPLATELPITISGEDFERRVAEQMWVVLRQLDRGQQKILVSEQVHFTTPALFRLLLKKSRSEGRKDRQLGVRYAQLALDSLAGVAGSLPAHDRANLRAQGWVWIGRAYRLALDFLAAEQSFNRADAELPKTNPRPLVLAELQRGKAALRWAQRRYEEALDLATAALPLFRGYGDDQLLTEALVMRSNILRHARDPEAAMPDLAEAESILARIKPAPAQLSLVVSTSLIDLQILGCNFQEASRSLEQARAAALEGDAGIGTLALLQAQEGHIALCDNRLQAAAEALEPARETFVALQDLAPATIVSLDLAIMHLRQGHQQEVIRIATEVLPVFDAYQIDSGAFLAGQLLRQALDSQTLTESLFCQMRALSAEHLLGF